jgi:threonine dehydrogenase-like Zn-dependent dehydrogenase
MRPWRSTNNLAALVEPLSVAWHAVSVSHFQVDDDVLVVGAGPIGIGIVQVLKARGASNVVVSEMSQIRRELAMKFGADHVFEPSNGTAVAQCKALCRDEGPAVVFDAAGVQAGLDLALASSRAGATIVNVAAWKFPPQFDALLLTMGEKKYIGTMTYLRQDFEHVLDALETGKDSPLQCPTKLMERN